MSINVYQDIEHLVSHPSSLPWAKPKPHIEISPPLPQEVTLSVANQIETARILKMWTLDELAQRSHLQVRLLEQFEIGRLPDVCAMHVICRELGLVLK